MASYNKIVLVGRLTRDPEMRYTGGGLAVVKFSVAVDRRFKNQQGERLTDFFDCSAFRQTAEFVSNYITKGRLVLVEGSIEFNEATGQDGQKRRYTNVIAENVQTLDSQRDGGSGAGGGASGGAGGGADAGVGGGGYGGAPRQNAGGGRAPQGDDGYFPDEDSSPHPQGDASAEAPRAAAPRAAAAPTEPAQPRKPVEPIYPEDDFDDSDPFADQ